MNEFLRSILDGIYSVIGNYGWSIMVFTFLIRLVLLPFDAKSRKSMRRMSLLQPKINELQKKYANDKEKLNQKTAELYRKEKINPLSSCLPMLLTMPVLFAMFAAMRMIANTQLAQQIFNLISGNEPQYEKWFWIKNIWMADSPFAAMVPDENSIRLIPGDIWRHAYNQFEALKDALPALADSSGSIIPYDFSTDESIKRIVEAMTVYMKSLDSYRQAIEAVKGFENYNLLFIHVTLYTQRNGYFVLPLLAAGTQVLMTKLNPAATNPNVAQGGKPAGNAGGFMKWFFPIFSIVICAGQNAGFSLYWVSANIIMSLQTWLLNKYFDTQDKRTIMVGEGTVK
jgi:YidC/Oxa1 family membrane protein insertase